MTATHLVVTLIVATVVSLLATPLARRLAVSADIMDRPGSHKSHSKITPYLGGLALVLATHAAVFAGGGIDRTTGRVLLVATLVGAVGLLDDSFTIQPLPRLGCQILAATMIWGVGIRFEVTGSPIADGVVSLVWIVIVTNAFNLLDNMDGLCGGTAAAAALGVAGVALAAGQVALAVTAVALTGACLGFLCFNWTPSTIFMGDTGSMFLGASVAALTLAVHTPGAASARAIAPLLIVGLPALDTATVALARARRGISVMQGGRDHLSHRLVALGLSRPRAVIVLLGVETVSVGCAIAVARGALDPWLALLVAAIPFAAVWLVTARAVVYQQPAIGLPKVSRGVLVGGATFVAALSAPAALAMLAARGSLETGAAQAQAGIQHEQSGQSAAAQQNFAEAAASFSAAQARLRTFGVSAGRLVPVVAVNLRASTTIAAIGLNVSNSGGKLAAGSDIQTLRIQQGSVPLDTLTRLAPTLQSLSKQLTAESHAVHRLPRTLLLPPIRRAVASLDKKLAAASKTTGQSADAATTLPNVLGAQGQRRYLLVVQNNAESRATGGFIGNFGELIVTSGHISLGRFDRIQALDLPQGSVRSVPAPPDYLARYAPFYPFDLWQNVNLSPDFATVGSVIANLYPASGGAAVDGVIGIDPVALADILRLTGPINVSAWPTPISAENVVQITLQGAYDALPNEDRRAAFLGDVAMAAFAALTRGDLGNPIQLAQTLGPAVTDRHLQIYLTDGREEAFATRLGAAGAILPTAADRFLLTTQNAAGNKVDYYLKRSINYDLAIEPPADLQGTATARVSGRITVTLTNGAPTTGHDADALGPYTTGFVAGENRMFVSMYTPLAVSASTMDGSPLAVQSSTELGENVYSAYVDIPAGATRTVSYTVNGAVHLDQGHYVLQLPRQPLLGTDHVSVALSVPPGWALASSTGTSSRTGRSTLDVGGPQSVSWTLHREGPLSWLDPVTSASAPPG